jgi:hypothetical protein
MKSSGSIRARCNSSSTGISIPAQTGDYFIVQDGALHGGIPHKCHYECIVFNLHAIAELNPLCVS